MISIFKYILPLAILMASCAAPESEEEATMTAGEYSGLQISRQQFDASGMQVSTAEKAMFADVVHLNGYVALEPTASWDVTTAIEGRITDILTTAGQEAERGQVLFRLESRELADLQQQYLETVAQLEYSDKELERQQLLSDASVNARKKLEEVSAENARLRAQKSGLTAQLKIIGFDAGALTSGSDLGVLNIRARANGVVRSIMVHGGEFVSSSSSLAMIDAPENIRLEFNAFPEDLSRIQKGMHLTFSDGSGSSKGSAHISGVVRSADAGNRNYTIVAHTDSIGSGVYAGAPVTGHIETTSSERIVFPASALYGDPEHPIVLVLSDSSSDMYTFRKLRLEEVEVNGQLAAVREGVLVSGDQLIVEGGHLLALD